MSGLRLVASRLACRRGGRLVFSGLDLDLGAGTALRLAGPNGIGKTSLLRILAGLLRPAEGEVTLRGGPADTPLAESVHFVGLREAVKPSLTVIEHLRHWRDLLGGPPAPDAVLLEAARLSDRADLPAGYLSAGQRRRLALARLEVAPRPVWLLDEPLTALDTDARERLTRRLAGFVAEGGLLVAASHEPLALPGMRTLPIARDLAGVCPAEAA